MHVKPGMHNDYIALEKAWKKIHAVKKEAGVIRNWALSMVFMPGADAEYNYITRNSVLGDEKLAAYLEGPYMPENWTSLLTADELELVMRTDEIRTIVKSEIWANEEVVLAPDYTKAKVHVFNFFDHPEGKDRADHFKVEKDIWMPVHKARVNDGKLKGWVLLRKVMPYGSSMPYHDATVDIYADMAALFGDPVPGYFEKVHPGKDMDELWAKTQANTDLIRGEVRWNLDRLE